jgi:Zn-dependent protease
VNIEQLIQQTAIMALPMLLAITLSEAARGRVAYWLGDKTGWINGRVTWNPAKHISPIQTIAMPLATFLLSQGTFLFGGGKPIPIDHRNLRDPKTGAIWIELASPIALFLMALLWYWIFVALRALHIEEQFFLQVSKAGVFVSLSLFAFQLLPIPPLAGGRILMYSLPPQYGIHLARAEHWSVWVVLLLAASGVLMPFWMRPITELGLSTLQLLTSPLLLLI